MNKEELAKVIGSEPRNSFIVYEMERLNHQDSVKLLDQLESQIIKDRDEEWEDMIDRIENCFPDDCTKVKPLNVQIMWDLITNWKVEKLKKVA